MKARKRYSALVLAFAVSIMPDAVLAQSAASAAARGTPAPYVATSPLQAARDALQTAIVKRNAAGVAAFIRSGATLDFDMNEFHRGRTGQSPLTIAVNLDHRDIVRLLLQAGASAARRDGHGQSAIHVARSPEAVRLLVQSGADPNAADDKGGTPVSTTVERGNVAALDTLLAAGARLDAPVRGSDLLTRAIESRQPGMVRALLDCGLDPRSPPTQALWRLIETGDEDNARLLIQRGADPNARNERETLLTRALFRKRWSVVEALVDAGVQVRLPDAPGCRQGGCLSIQIARLASFHPPVLARLVAHGLDLSAAASDGHTALTSLIVERALAVRVVASGQQAVVAQNAVTGVTSTRVLPAPATVREIPAPDNVTRVDALLENGADPNVKFSQATPLMLAIVTPAAARDFAGKLLDHGGRIEFEATIPKSQPGGAAAVALPGTAPMRSITDLISNDQGVLTGMTVGPLTWALLHGRADVVLRLIEREKTVRRADRYVLYFAAATQQSDAIPALLGHTREVNVSDRANVTPLLFAAAADHAPAVKALLAAGADVNARSDREWPPLLERSIYHYLGGHPPSRPAMVGGYTPLRAARERGQGEVARLLAEAGGRE